MTSRWSRAAWLPRAAVQACAATLLAVTTATAHRPLAAVTAAILCVVATAAFLRRSPFHVTLADHVTHVRVLLLAATAGMLVGEAAALLVLALVGVSVLLDGVDGRLARSRGEASEAGGRFDMAVDCALTAVLSIAAAAALGWWVLLIGALPYGYALAGRRVPALRRPLPPRLSRKVIGSIPPLALGAGPLLPQPAAVVVTAVTLALLLWSFGRDTAALLRR
ncbi:CDP-alcohol phosphatidyltransferase family protein [Pseudactinotalea suaedae]|uniref:CDP-alcohol phosphatidyltransferase family protein n=1 Tax=Pseudactinotalea suaedae TaxID=1524924 RepID=UPI001F5013C3|nr:CDP-alcohol phosphatidyltransferase family protein [Pseudactinotalea suaedae]